MIPPPSNGVCHGTDLERDDAIKPDMATAEWLKTRKLILYSLDCDEAGRKRYEYWRSRFPNLRAWPPDSNKSPEDSFLKDGVNLKEWYLAGVSYWLQSIQVPCSSPLNVKA